ncbi:MAG: hypothetical protein U0132_21585 [Gemmatimonadaceae bacterium]
MNLRHTARLAGLALIVPYAIVRLGRVDYWDILDDVDLAVHEAGHLVFAPLGDHMSFLGGSLLQVLVPLAFVLYFWRSRQAFAGGITLAWVGVNLVNVSRYIGDARAQDLPLLGGENAIHDWWYLLTEWDLLPRDHDIARAVHLLGACAFASAVIVAWFAERGDERERAVAAAAPSRESLPVPLPRR